MLTLLVPAVLLAILPAFVRGNGLEYCSVDKFDHIPGGLAFTKEVITTEYAIAGEFKAIHCCVKGYRSIEWSRTGFAEEPPRYKDNKPYPWPGFQSNLIIWPEDKNQTIYTRQIKVTDAGRYSCRARNDTTTIEGDITLTVLNQEPSKPLVTYAPASQLVRLGGTARLFCEAYVGKVDLPDAKNSATWWKGYTNVTLPTSGRVSQQMTSRIDDVVGAYLKIEDVRLDDYDRYECVISNGIGEKIAVHAHVYLQD